MLGDAMPEWTLAQTCQVAHRCFVLAGTIDDRRVVLVVRLVPEQLAVRVTISGRRAAILLRSSTQVALIAR
eukprot:1897123-Pleurochrysis_carterae.AAC.1